MACYAVNIAFRLKLFVDSYWLVSPRNIATESNRMFFYTHCNNRRHRAPSQQQHTRRYSTAMAHYVSTG